MPHAYNKRTSPPRTSELPHDAAHSSHVTTPFPVGMLHSSVTTIVAREVHGDLPLRHAFQRSPSASDIIAAGMLTPAPDESDACGAPKQAAGTGGG